MGVECSVHGEMENEKNFELKASSEETTRKLKRMWQDSIKTDVKKVRGSTWVGFIFIMIGTGVNTVMKLWVK